MLEGVGPRLQGGAVVRSRAVRGKGVREGDIAGPLEALEEASNGVVTFGSYPWFGPEGYGLHLVARSADEAALAKAGEDLRMLIKARGAEPEEVEDAR
jgi:molybdopterin-biosynthesis enzyme MoeA-like protein